MYKGFCRHIGGSQKRALFMFSFDTWLLISLRLVSKRVLWNGVKVWVFDLCEPKLKFFAFEEVYLCATQGRYFLRVVIFINTQDL